MKNTKVLVLAMKYFPASGGSATYAYNLAFGLCQDEGFHVKVMAPRYPRKMDDVTSGFEIKRMRLTGMRMGSLRIFFAAVQVWIAYLRFRPDAIWSTSFAGCRVLGWIPFLKCKYIGTIHGGGIHRRYPSRNWSNRFGDRLGMRFMRRADVLVTISQYSKKLMAAKLPDWVMKKIRIIYNGIRFDESTFVRQEQAIEKLPQFQNRRIVLTVGRLIRAKGQDVVIHSIQKVIRKVPNMLYIIVGEGPERASLEKLTRDLALEPYVYFAGYTDQATLEIYYGLCDIFVLAGRRTESFEEMFGLVLIEAGVRGKPSIATTVGGIPEAIAANETGVIIEPDAPELLAEKIVSLLSNDNLRRQMGQKAVKRVKENFSYEVMAKNNATLLKELMRL